MVKGKYLIYVRRQDVLMKLMILFYFFEFAVVVDADFVLYVKGFVVVVVYR